MLFDDELIDNKLDLVSVLNVEYFVLKTCCGDFGSELC